MTKQGQEDIKIFDLYCRDQHPTKFTLHTPPQRDLIFPNLHQSLSPVRYIAHLTVSSTTMDLQTVKWLISLQRILGKVFQEQK